MLSFTFASAELANAAFDLKAVRAEIHQAWEEILPAVFKAKESGSDEPLESLEMVNKLKHLDDLERAARAVLRPDRQKLDATVEDFLNDLKANYTTLSENGRQAICLFDFDELIKEFLSSNIILMKTAAVQSRFTLTDIFGFEPYEMLLLRYAAFVGGDIFLKSGDETKSQDLSKIKYPGSVLVASLGILEIDSSKKLTCESYLQRSTIAEFTRLANTYPFPSPFSLLGHPALFKELISKNLFRVSDVTSMNPLAMKSLTESAFKNEERAQATFVALQHFCKVVADAFNHTPITLRAVKPGESKESKTKSQQAPSGDAPEADQSPLYSESVVVELLSKLKGITGEENLKEEILLHFDHECRHLDESYFKRVVAAVSEALNRLKVPSENIISALQRAHAFGTSGFDAHAHPD